MSISFSLILNQTTHSKHLSSITSLQNSQIYNIQPSNQNRNCRSLNIKCIPPFFGCS